MSILSRKRWPWGIRSEIPPLVDNADLELIYHAAGGGLAPPLQGEREVQHALLGDNMSAYTGRGYEFADNRPFQRGDEARFINWRALARSGRMYRKVFYEERRPPLYLVIDRRASMRFGTRTRLKLAQATRLALFHLFLAQRQSLPVAAILLDQQPQWFAPGYQRDSMQSLIRQLCAPCPPLPDTAGQGDLKSVLQQCAVRLAPGCIIIMYSDFHELQPEDVPALYELAMQHSVFARQILDPGEEALPARGVYEFTYADGETSLDCNDASLTTRYHQRMQERQQQIADCLLTAGIEHHVYRTNETLFATHKV